MKRIWRLLLPLGGVALLVGVAWGLLRVTMPSPTVPEELEAVWEVWQILQQDSVLKNELGPQQLSEAAIQGILDALGDPYASFLTPEQYRLETQDIKGEFEGIGVEVDSRDGPLTVIAPLRGTPAERAGIRPGDVILEVDGEPLEEMSLIQAVLKIRGPKGTTVELLVQQQGAAEPVLIPIVRDVIEVETVALEMLEGDVAYLSISSFADNTDEVVREKLSEVIVQGARGLILDLRNNPGGLVTTTVNIASEFLEQGAVFYEVDGDGQRQEHTVQPGGVATEIPMVVLVNEFSASASEILAGVLQAHQRATLIGAQTFGKGSVNLLRRLNDGSGLFYSIAYWQTPDDVHIEGEGITPDIEVEQSQDAEEDVQLQRALEHLQATLASLAS